MAESPWVITKVSGHLPTRNVSLEVATKALTWGKPEELEIFENDFSIYHGKAEAGATLMPRIFWFVEPSGAESGDWKYMTTPARQSVRGKPPWKDISFEGRIENTYLYTTFLQIYPFLVGPPSIIALPLRKTSTGKKLQLLEVDEVAASGTPEFAKWLKKTEKCWNDNKKDSQSQDMTNVEYLNNHGNLLRQNIKRTRCVYSANGTNIRAAVVSPEEFVSQVEIPVEGFVLDNNFYEILGSKEECHYLAAILNSGLVNERIKNVQTQGQFGARHIHRRPFEVLPIPEYDGANEKHKRLAAISMLAHQEFAGQKGRVRREQALAPISELMAEANEIVEGLFG